MKLIIADFKLLKGKADLFHKLKEIDERLYDNNIFEKDNFTHLCNTYYWQDTIEKMTRTYIKELGNLKETYADDNMEVAQKDADVVKKTDQALKDVSTIIEMNEKPEGEKINPVAYVIGCIQNEIIGGGHTNF